MLSAADAAGAGARACLTVSLSFAGCTKLSSCSSPSGFSSPTPCSSTCPPRSSSLLWWHGCQSAGAAWSTCSSGWPWSVSPVSTNHLVWLCLRGRGTSFPLSLKPNPSTSGPAAQALTAGSPWAWLMEANGSRWPPRSSSSVLCPLCMGPVFSVEE